MENEDNKENTNPEGAGWQRAVGGITPATRVFSIWKELAGVKRWRARPRGTISSPNASCSSLPDYEPVPARVTV
jgi:hypothetical protein